MDAFEVGRAGFRPPTTASMRQLKKIVDISVNTRYDSSVVNHDVDIDDRRSMAQDPQQMLQASKPVPRTVIA
jgi:hypothetical protein